MEVSNEIRKYTKLDYNAYKDMFREYFLKDFKIDITQEETENICTEITQQVEAHILFLDLLILNSAAKGFIIYQIDSPKSDWCEKEGWGFIREVYIASDFRGKGYGKSLITHVESRLRQLLVPSIYLTSDESGNFWIKMGYQDSGETSSKNKARIFMK